MTTIARRLSPRAQGKEAMVALSAVVAGVIGSLSTVLEDRIFQLLINIGDRQPRCSDEKVVDYRDGQFMARCPGAFAFFARQPVPVASWNNRDALYSHGLLTRQRGPRGSHAGADAKTSIARNFLQVATWLHGPPDEMMQATSTQRNAAGEAALRRQTG